MRKKVKKGSKPKTKKERWSSWFLKAFFVALIGYVFYTGIPSFIENRCLRCALPTLGIGGVASALILALLNEAKNYLGK